ncbi:homocysteine S-methyltransferase family protein [Clostridium hydrogeniformans]|uniref:homocysteine S-methyltransferase family protein n=1 Tax=Clostridium hydrogeniformans TaxID=349933 RepID=UPI0004849D53|nr:homocysteine S-methyltransferase family protein [Clostridium hydrogeniformans]
MEVKEYIRKNILVFDGAMGTMLQDMGLKLGELPEELNITSSKTIIDIHRRYINAGAKVITTNTFGANKIKLKDSEYSGEEIISSAINNAKEARGNSESYIALDIGPIGQLLKPMGTLSFYEAYDIFKEQVEIGVKYGVDIILIETMTDLLEAKAAVLAAKENSDIPVFVTMTFEKDGRTFSGTDILSMVITLEGLGVDALGINCSLGPLEMLPLIEELTSYASIPLIVQPNAGLPIVRDGRTVYDIGKEEFGEFMKALILKGINIVGGCCGTTDEFINELYKLTKGRKPCEVINKNIVGLCSSSKTILINGVNIVGERINPTGKKLFKEALKNQDMDYILKEAIEQVEKGSNILDVNVGLPDIDEKAMMKRVIEEIQAIINTPLQIDSSDGEVIEEALRIYNGKAIVNSVNGEDSKLLEILPIIKKYGAMVVGLTLDKKGIPEKAEDRYRIAEKIIRVAESYGIGRENIIIDCLTLTASTNQEEVIETLKAIEMVKNNLGVKTTLGVSNISFGLPNRGLINKTFLSMALTRGLDLPIINPKDEEMLNIINAFKLLNNEDKGGEGFINKYSNVEVSKENNHKENKHMDIKEIIKRGLKDKSYGAAKELLKIKDELSIVNEELIPALDQVGNDFQSGKIFLPQLIQCSETVKGAFEAVKESLVRNNRSSISKGKILLATVEGDIHDIGKNIVKVILENYGFEIVDLGKNVATEDIVNKVREEKIKLVGLSALMTTTVKSMEKTIKRLREEKLDSLVMVGGAVLNEDYARLIKADFYAKDAKESVNIANKVFSEE